LTAPPAIRTVPAVQLSLTMPLTAAPPARALRELLQAADRLGYGTVWMPEFSGWDAFLMLGQIATETKRIRLGTAVANVFSRTPALLAQSAASLDALSGGRFVLGLGTSGQRAVTGWHGVPYERGVRRMRETIEIVRLVLQRQPLHYRGELFQLDQGMSLLIQQGRGQVPIYVGSLTPAGIELAGEVADGWLPMWFSACHYDEVFRPHLERGAARAGRSPADVRICVVTIVVVTGDMEAGRALVRPQIALYLGVMGSGERNYYAELWARYGYGAEARRIQELYAAGRPDEAVAAVTDDMVDLVAIVGPAAECRRRLLALESLGVDEVSMRLLVPDADAAEMANVLEDLLP
jgi:F420-dependent oxidoreductase-like protein